MRLSSYIARAAAVSRRYMLVAACVSFLPNVAAHPALAGVASLEGPSPENASGKRAAIEAAEAYYAALLEKAPGTVQPLVDYAGITAPTRCDASAAPRTHAVLVAASDAGEPFSRLVGPDNDIELLIAALRVRGVNDSLIDPLVAGRADREELATAFRVVVESVNCGDRVLFYFSGNTARAEDLIASVIPDELKQAHEDVAISELWLTGSRDSTHEATVALRWAGQSGMFLALNGQRDGVLEVVSANDISEFVTAVRNRMADVTVIIDTSYATTTELAERQHRAGDGQLWRFETGAPQDRASDLARYETAKLLPNHGGFAALYSSVGDSHSTEIGFDDGQGGKTIYGVFTFRLANAIQNRGSVTVRALAESLKVASDDTEAEQRHRIEASDPEMALFSDDGSSLPRTDPITITEPTPKRGANTVDRPEVRIAGRVEWSTPARAVLVDGKIATLLADGSFEHTLSLQSGLNTIEIVALTRDGRTHEKRLEFLFEGDRQALEGEGARYAVVIANQNYGSGTGFDPLVTPFADADALIALLRERYGFRTEAKLPTGQTIPWFLRMRPAATSRRRSIRLASWLERRTPW